MADGGQDIGQLSIFRPGIVHIVGHHDRQAQLRGERRGLGDQPVVIGRQVMRQFDEEAAGTWPIPATERRGVALRDRPCAGPVPHPQPPDQLPVATAGQGDEPLSLAGQQRLTESRHALRPGHVGLRHEPAQAAPADLGMGEQDQVRPATALADPAQVLLDRLAMTGQPRAPWSGPDRHALGGLVGREIAPAGAGSGTASSRPPRDDDDPIRVRDGRVQQLDLQSDDRMQPHGLRRADEPDRSVKTRMVGDGQAGQPQLHGALHEVVRRRRPIEERKVRVAVELGVRGGCHEVAPVLTGWLGAANHRTSVLSCAHERWAKVGPWT